MKRNNLLLVLVFAAVAVLQYGVVEGFANTNKPYGSSATARGGFTGPGPSISTVEQVKNMRDDSIVALRGRIVQRINHDHYVFQDGTGTIKIEIEDKRWQGLQVGPDDIVEIYGELDKNWLEVEVEVKHIFKPV